MEVGKLFQSLRRAIAKLTAKSQIWN